MEQCECADFILLNKMDRCSPEEASLSLLSVFLSNARGPYWHMMLSASLLVLRLYPQNIHILALLLAFRGICEVPKFQDEVVC